MNENGLKHILQNLSNLVYLGDDFQTFSHLGTQNLAQSRSYLNSALAAWPGMVFSSEVEKCPHLPLPTQQFYCYVVRFLTPRCQKSGPEMELAEEESQEKVAVLCFCVLVGQALLF